jgi:hypothetical protein
MATASDAVPQTNRRASFVLDSAPLAVLPVVDLCGAVCRPSEVNQRWSTLRTDEKYPRWSEQV